MCKKHCYNCGKDIKENEKSISLDDLNHSHSECLYNQPKDDSKEKE